MDKSKFDEIVEARANERVQARFAKMRRAVYQALLEFFHPRNYGSYGNYSESEDWGGRFQYVMIQLASDDNRKGWDTEKLKEDFWESERNAVTKELLSQMDEFQKALLAAQKEPNPDDCTPA